MPPADLPLSALLSQTLVAFTIEFDNEFEHRAPHRTTRHGATAGTLAGPWLASMVMYLNCMRFVSDEGVSVRNLEALARTTTNLRGMERWGYIRVGPDPADKRPKPPQRDWLIRPKAKGAMAREIWRPLFGVIEERWRTRFGADVIDQLGQSLRALVDPMALDLPDCLPILGYGLFSKAPEPTPNPSPLPGDLPLPALLARVLLAFAIEFESESDLSLAICADVLRVLDEKGTRMRDLPLLSGVSKEAINMAMGILRKKNLAIVGTDRAVRLTAAGMEAKDAYLRLLQATEERWRASFGGDRIQTLRHTLELLAPRLFEGLEPYPDGWRASVRKPATLPHYPMVLHRGGYPDGS